MENKMKRYYMNVLFAYRQAMRNNAGVFRINYKTDRYYKHINNEEGD